MTDIESDRSASDGYVYIVNRPHVQSILSQPTFRFIFKHLQNLAWTVENKFLRRKINTERNVVNDNEEKKIENPYFQIEENQDFLISMYEKKNEFGVLAKKNVLTLIIPTRFQKSVPGALHKFSLEKAIESVKNQTSSKIGDVKFVLGVDFDTDIPSEFSNRSDIVIARSAGKSQLLALNAAHACVDPDTDFIAFLEDDDWWHPEFLTWGLLALEHYDFVSSSQLVVDENGRVATIFDYPTPSGWLMPASTYFKVGPASLKCKWHWDNEWLGRLTSHGFSRCHIVESTAPTSLGTAEWRSGIQNILKFGGPKIEIQRQNLAIPLVYRLSHSQSGTTAVKSDLQASLESKGEYEWITSEYGRLPW